MKGIPRMFATSIAGSLPKPAWLAETHKPPSTMRATQSVRTAAPPAASAHGFLLV